MFEYRRSPSGVKLILPPLEQKPVSQKTVTHRKILSPLEKLKILRKLRKGYLYY